MGAVVALALKTRTTLRDHFLPINREVVLLREHGHYLVGTLAVGDGIDHPGADAKTAWYNRNLRIFSNLLWLVERPGERVFVLIGAGHVPILRHAARASPAIELVEVGEILR